MPSGYTADLENVSFSEFALRCARGFGALITMRDEALDVPIPDRIEASNYFRDTLREGFEALVNVESWDASHAEIERMAAYAQAIERHEKLLSKSDTMRKCYEAMIQRVENWTPPTPDHTGLKDFMLKQLLESIKYDCFDEKNLSMPKVPKAHTGQDYKHERLCIILDDIGYRAKEYREELERSRERTDWLRSLRLSLA